MPDSLKIHSGERVDLVDYVQGANTYTQESQKFTLERTILDRRSRILDGFRIRVEDQGSFPGMITVFNGNALDRDGQLINNEQLENDSRSVTLLGTSQNFYVEIEFTNTESTTDSRFFWDPTVPNTTPEPNGQEFGLNVATRLTPDWRIVTPVSTTGFEQTSDPNSIRVPVGVFRTDGSNAIVGGSNPGLTLVRAASVLELDVSAGDTVLRVVDARVLPATLPFTISVDAGAGSAETRTVSTLDRTNGLVTVSVGLTSDHLAGAIIRVTSGAADLVKQKTDPSDPALDSLLSPPGHPDPAQRLWQADEVRGSALTASKETFGARDDTNLRSLKDHVDFLAAQLRELKFGDLRPENVNTAPPSTFATRPRYFDKAGSVAGGRSNTLSIGNGTTSFGDFNGTDGDVVFAAAIAALPAGGGTIFVKAGTYSFSTNVTSSKVVRIVGEGRSSVVLTNLNTSGPAFTVTANTTLENLTIQKGGSAVARVCEVTAAVSLTLYNVTMVGQLLISNSVTATVSAFDSSLTATGSNIVVGAAPGIWANSVLENCQLVAAAGIFMTGAMQNIAIRNCVATTDLFYEVAATSNMTNVSIENCDIAVDSYVVGNLSGSGAIDGVRIVDNKITVLDLAPGEAPFAFTGTGTLDRISIRNNYVNITGGSTSSGSVGYVFLMTNNASSNKLYITGNEVTANTGSFIVGVSLDQDTLTATEIKDNLFTRTQEMVRLGGATGSLDTGNVLISGCVHDNKDEHLAVYGVRLVSNPTLSSLIIDNCVFMNYRKNGSTGVRLGVDLTTTSTTAAKFVVRGCVFENIGYGSATTAMGVMYDASTASDMPHYFDICDNKIANVSSNNTNTSAGIYIVSSSASNSMKVKACGNHINTVGEDSTTSGSTYGIFVANANSVSASTTLTGNTVLHVISSSGASPATGIGIDDCNNVIIADNYVSNVNSPGATSLLNGCSIRLTGAGQMSNIHVLNNRLDQSTSTTASEGRYTLNLINSQVSLYRLCGNIISTSTSGIHGILVDGNSAGAVLVDGKVDSNIVYLNDTAASSGNPAWGIRCLLGGASYNLTVDGNTIEETTLDATASTVHKGIEVKGNTTGGHSRGISISNNNLSAPKTGTLASSAVRDGIKIDACEQTKIVGNLVSWNEPGVLEGNGILITTSILTSTWSGHLVSGNFVRADDDAGVVGNEFVVVTTYMINGYLTSNQFGESDGGGSPTGTISPSVAAGGWVYANNMV